MSENLVERVRWNYKNSPQLHELYMYGEATSEANAEMQVPLEKLYHYEKKISQIERYINSLNKKIKTLRQEIEAAKDVETVVRKTARLETIFYLKENLSKILSN